MDASYTTGHDAAALDIEIAECRANERKWRIQAERLEEELCKESGTLLFRLRAEIELAAAFEAIPADDTIKMPLPEYETPKAEVAYWADTAE